MTRLASPRGRPHSPRRFHVLHEMHRVLSIAFATGCASAALAQVTVTEFPSRPRRAGPTRSPPGPTGTCGSRSPTPTSSGASPPTARSRSSRCRPSSRGPTGSRSGGRRHLVHRALRRPDRPLQAGHAPVHRVQIPRPSPALGDRARRRREPLVHRGGRQPDRADHDGGRDPRVRAAAVCFPTGIAAGADGNIWFTLEIGDQIGRIDPRP